MKITTDNRVVLTLDAGGTNFVFTAIKAGKEIVPPFTTPSNGHDLVLSLKAIREGFQSVIAQLNEIPVAISFAFPGPADYPAGIIGDLTNLPGFRGGVALGPLLEKQFKMPVFINNDGDLFAYGEALGGILPEVNFDLIKQGNKKTYNNLIGLTIGTGFGGGIVRNNQLFIGDNSLSGEVWALSNRINPLINAEEGISTRFIISEYCRLSGEKLINSLMPKDIFEIAMAQKPGDKQAAITAYERFGAYLGDVIANLMTILDSIVVIGGGLTGAKQFYMPAVFKEINNSFILPNGSQVNRLVQKVYDLDDIDEYNNFIKPNIQTILIPGSNDTINYYTQPRLAIANSKLGASKAIALGAYAYALNALG